MTITFSNKLQEDIKKLKLSFKYIDALYKYQYENNTDHTKRSLLRFFFIQIENSLGIIRRIKNLLNKEGIVNRVQKDNFEKLIKILSDSYTGYFDLIRNKIGAHNQPIDFLVLLTRWGDIDLSIIKVLYDDIQNIKSALKTMTGIDFLEINLMGMLPAQNNTKPESAERFSFVADRLAFSQKNKVGIIAGHPAINKLQLIFSIIDFINIDFELISKIDNPKNYYCMFLFEIGWLMAFIDICSLIDNIFEDTKYEKSILSYWDAGYYRGYKDLMQLNDSRNLILEKEIKNIRNTLAAHIDDQKSLEDIFIDFDKINLLSVVDYTYVLINSFFECCGKDTRTFDFKLNNIELNILGIETDLSKPFGN